MFAITRRLPFWSQFVPRVLDSCRAAITQLWTPVELPAQGGMGPAHKTDEEIFAEAILQLNRNARAPKLANHGARPCSSYMRRLKRKGYYRRWKEKTMPDPDDNNPKHGHILDEGELPGR